MTNFLTDAELTQMRADVADVALPDTCDVLSLTQVSDGQGGFADTWGAATASVACRLDYRGGIESVAGGAVRPFTGWYLTIPYDTSLTTANRIYHGTISYNVIEVDANKSWSLFLYARLERA